SAASPHASRMTSIGPCWRCSRRPSGRRRTCGPLIRSPTDTTPRLDRRTKAEETSLAPPAWWPGQAGPRQQERRSVDLLRLRDRALELLDREARAPRHAQDGGLAARQQLDRGRELGCRLVRDDDRAVAVGVDQVA